MHPRRFISILVVCYVCGIVTTNVDEGEVGNKPLPKFFGFESFFEMLYFL